MFSHLPALALCALCSAASAQTIHKCSVGGKVAYSDRPCLDGGGSRLAVPVAPAPDPAAAKELQRQKALLAQLQKERGVREVQDAKNARADARASQAAGARRQRCANMRQQQRWAAEDAAKAAGPGTESLKRKADRQGQAVALACPA